MRAIVRRRSRGTVCVGSFGCSCIFPFPGVVRVRVHESMISGASALPLGDRSKDANVTRSSHFLSQGDCALAMRFSDEGRSGPGLTRNPTAVRASLPCMLAASSTLI